MSEITYARAGGPPDRWQSLEVIDLDTGMPVERVVEVVVGLEGAEGWLVRVVVGPDGRIVVDGDEAKQERITGRFEIRRRSAA